KTDKVDFDLLNFHFGSSPGASVDPQCVQYVLVGLNTETRPLWKHKISVGRLIPVAERTFGEITIQTLDHRRMRQRRAEVRGRNQARTEIRGMRSNRHVRLVGHPKYIARDGDAANLGDARLHIVDRPALDQSGKVSWR